MRFNVIALENDRQMKAFFMDLNLSYPNKEQSIYVLRHEIAGKIPTNPGNLQLFWVNNTNEEIPITTGSDIVILGNTNLKIHTIRARFGTKTPPKVADEATLNKCIADCEKYLEIVRAKISGGATVCSCGGGGGGAGSGGGAGAVPVAEGAPQMEVEPCYTLPPGEEHGDTDAASQMSADTGIASMDGGPSNGAGGE